MRGSIITAEISEIPGVFQKLNQNTVIFDDAVGVIKKKHLSSVMLVARGSSGNAALFLKALIETELGLPVGIAAPSAVSINRAKLNFSHTLVIGISQSGQSPDLLSYLEVAKSGGALVLAMTNDSGSPMAKLADLHIDLLAGEERALAATKSYSAQLFAGLKLIRTWQGKVNNFADASYRLSELLSSNQISDSIISKITNYKNLIFIGREYGYANAKEGALKIQETSYQFVQSYSAATYLHGPIAAVDQGSCVFVVSPTGSSERGLSKAVIETRNRGAQIIWIGSGGFSQGDEVVLSGLTSNDQALNCVTDASILQILAVKLALKLGNDPDVSRGLRKVTLTY